MPRQLRFLRQCVEVSPRFMGAVIRLAREHDLVARRQPFSNSLIWVSGEPDKMQAFRSKLDSSMLRGNMKEGAYNEVY